MSKKSASQFKPIKTQEVQQHELPSIEETFDNAKQAFVNTLEVSVRIAKRIDNFLNVRDYVINFYGRDWSEIRRVGADRVEYIKRLQNITVSTYEKMLEKTLEFSLEEFSKEEMKDYYEEIVPDVESIDTMDKILEAGLIFLSVKPFGEKMTALHHTILDEIAQRKYMEE